MNVPEIVECHSEFEYPERPVAFTWQGERIHIDEIVAQWRTPNGKRFRVSCEDGRAFEIVFTEDTDQWDIRPI